MTTTPTPQYLRCKAGHEWEEWWPMPMVIEAAISRMRNCLCPECGERKIYLRMGPAEKGFGEPDPPSAG